MLKFIRADWAEEEEYEWRIYAANYVWKDLILAFHERQSFASLCVFKAFWTCAEEKTKNTLLLGKFVILKTNTIQKLSHGLKTSFWMLLNQNCFVIVEKYSSLKKYTPIDNYNWAISK